jgi:hypothetical protein
VLTLFCSSVNEFLLIAGVKFCAEFVVLTILITIPFFHEIDTESLVVLESHDEEISIGDGIINGESSCVTKSISIRRQFGAFEEDSTDLREFNELLLHLFDDLGSAKINRDLFAFSNSFKVGQVFDTYDMEAFVLVVNTTLISDDVSHGLEGFAVGSHDENLFGRTESTCDCGELGQSRHEDGLLGVCSSKSLEVHHESTISCESTDTLCIKPIDSFQEFLLNIRGHFTFHTHFEGEAGNASVMDIISPRSRVINIAGCWGIVVIKTNDTKTNVVFHCALIHTTFFLCCGCYYCSS